MQVDRYALYPFWDPQGIAEPYLLDLQAQASWGGFDANRPVFVGLIGALRAAYGAEYDFTHVSRQLAEINDAARQARAAMKSDPGLLPSLYDLKNGTTVVERETAVKPQPEVPPHRAEAKTSSVASPPARSSRVPPVPNTKSFETAEPKKWHPSRFSALLENTTDLSPAGYVVPQEGSASKRLMTKPATTTPRGPERPSPQHPAKAPSATTQVKAAAAAPAQGLINGARLHRSLTPTWFALVGFTWIALIWGAIISMPIGIGFGIAGGMVVGIFAVPMFATVFGFMGMSRASANAFKDIDFQDVAPDDNLLAAATRYSALLGIPPPRVGTMSVNNAFAMGASPETATVAIGEPLRRSMSHDQVLAVLGHELGHVVSGDMRRMMLMRCFQNATVWYMFAQGAKQFMRWVISWAGELFILSFSRKREFWADAIGAELAGKDAMIGALRALERAPPLTALEATHARFMIRGRFSGLLNTHPSFDERVIALEQETYLKRLPRASGTD